MADNNFLTTLPAPVEGAPQRNLPLPYEVYRASAMMPETESAAVAVPLSHYLWIFRRNWWKILLFVACAVAATAVISMRLTPVFESTVTIDIDRQMPSGIIGQESTRSVTNDSDQFLATQAKLIQSDSVLRPVAQQLKLSPDPEAQDAQNPKSPSADDAPVLLRNLKVTRPPNTYLLLISYRSPDPRLAADVANATAHSYLEHTYNIRFKSSASLSAFMEKQLEELKAKMERSSSALAQFERELNVINPEQKTSILSARLLQLNTEYTNAQGDRVRKESAFKSVSGGSLEAAQVSTQGEALKRLSERLDEEQQKFAEVKSDRIAFARSRRSNPSAAAHSKQPRFPPREKRSNGCRNAWTKSSRNSPKSNQIGSRSQGVGVQIRQRRLTRSSPGFHPGRSAQTAVGTLGRRAAEIRRSQIPLRPQPSGVPKRLCPTGGITAPNPTLQGEHRPAGRRGVSRGSQPGTDVAQGRGRNQGRIRQLERPFL